MTGGQRIIDLVLIVGIAVALIGGAYLVAANRDAVEDHNRFLCAFGGAIGAQPLKQREAETSEEFRQRVAQTRGFMDSLEADLQDCDVPTTLRIHPSSKGVLGEKGVGAVSGDSPSGRPSPPPGGRTERPGTVPTPDRPPTPKPVPVPDSPVATPPNPPTAPPSERPCTVNALGICVDLGL